MPHAPRILVIAATGRELAAPAHTVGVLCGVGPVEAAAATTAAIAEYRPTLVLHVGIAGAHRTEQLSAGTLVIGSRAEYVDLGELPAAWASRVVVPPMALLHAVQRALPLAITRPIGTSARVGGTTACPVEAMEGFGVLRAAERLGVPAIEVRAISNDIEEVDRTRWAFDTAFTAITAATPHLVSALEDYAAHA
jgi:nucleoside phosphorylase